MNSYQNYSRKANPRHNANCLSASTFLYTIPIFWKGYKKEFDEHNMYDVADRFQSEVLGNDIEAAWNREVKSAYKAKRSPSLRRVLLRMFGIQHFLWGVLLAVAECVIRPAQAVLVGKLVSYHGTNSHVVEQGVGIALLVVMNVALFHVYSGNALLSGLKAKVACSNLIYRKTLKLNHSAIRKTNVGRILNLLSNDVVVFIKCGLYINFLWIGPTQCLIVTYLMYHEVGFSAIVGVFLLLIFIPFYSFVARKASKYRSRMLKRTDERMGLINEVISGIEVIKMYVWEKPIQNLVTYVRRLECKWIRLLNFTKATYMTVDIILIPILLCTTIGVYVQHNEITAAKVFSLIVFYNSLRLPMAWFFPQALSLLAEALVSVDRISSFLINEEVNMQLTKNADKSVAVNITNGVAGWDEDVILRDINVTITRGSLVAVMGQVGCGKSSLINVILKELPLTSGEILINGKISFASQEPWLFCGSVRDNILFGEEMDTARYNEVVRSCSLECDFNLLPFGDRTLVGGRGASLSGGQKARISLARAVYREADIYLLDEPFSAVDVRVGQQIYQEGIKSFLKRKTVILVTQQLQYLRDADQVIELDNGTLISSKQWKKKDTDDPQECFDAVTTAEVPTIDKVVEEIRSHRSVSRNVYATYFAFGGNICHNAIMWAFLLLSQALMSGGSYYLAYWVNQVDYGSVTTKSVSDEEIHFYIYASITLACVIMTSFASYLFYALCLKSSKQLHDNMLNSILQAPMRFFNTNPQGQITNRFSQDTEIVDIQLPTVTLNALQLTLGMIASVVLVAYVNSWFLILVVAVSSCIYLIQAFCVKTIRNIKRMENITRSPVLEHISSSLQGLSTIRAFGAEEIVRREFDCHQNLHICCGEIFISTTQAFASLLDYTCAIYVVIVTITLTAFDNGILGGNLGLALTQCLQLTTILQWSVRQATDVETQMASTERIVEYNKIDHERNLGGRLPPGWPSNGEITFNNVCLKYSQQDSPVLKNLTFKIASKEKVGIVGRTGAGKSSIVSALFRFSHITGQILVDGVDTEQLNLKELRTKISIIPQNPVIFSGTLRRNLDPMQVIEDSKLWSALEDVELKDFFSGLPLGLDFVFEQGGLNVSVGQRQLICLARVILRKNKILVLDEATASIDRETDYLVQRAIRKRFADCTVISIAHRIETIMDCDRVMVMDAGELVEFDAPSVLLQNVNGHFYRTAQQACKGNKLARQQL